MKKQGIDTMTPAQAHWVLSQLAADHKIDQRDIDRYLGRVDNEIAALESRLEALKKMAQAASAAPKRVRGPRAGASATRARRRRPATVTPEVAASRALQGRYISMVKHFPKSERAKYKLIAQSRGREEAIRKMAAALK